MIEGQNGWTEWWEPLPGYRLGCCDCGLVHDVEFQAVKLVKRKGLDIETGRKVKGAVILMRARRNNRSTANLRRHAKKGA